MKSTKREIEPQAGSSSSCKKTKKTKSAKQLINLPDEVLENICSFLNFGSLLNFSLCNKKCNEIFSGFRNLDRIFFHARGDHGKICKITRDYKHIVEAGDVMPKQVWLHFTETQSIRSYRYDTEPEHHDIVKSYGSFKRCFVLTLEKILQMLPAFTNLNSLELVNVGMSSMGVVKLKSLKNQEALEMKHLRILNIDPEFLLKLLNFLMKFPNDKLVELRLHDSGQHRASKNLNKLEELRILIRSQKNLEVLSLTSKRSGVVKQLFDRPMNLESQLKSFEACFTKSLKLFNATQQDNLCEMLFAQKNLESLQLDFNLGEDVELIPKLLHLRHWRLDMKLKKRVMRICEPALVNPRVFDNFTFQDLTLMQNPDLITQKLDLTFIVKDIENRDIDSTLEKFPNVTTLTMRFHYCNKKLMLHSSLNRLQHLTTLNLVIYDVDVLSSICIPNLKNLLIKLHVDLWGKIGVLKGLLEQNTQIENFVFGLDAHTIKTRNDILELFECALKELKSLRYVEFAAFDDLYLNKPPYFHYNEERMKPYIKIMQQYAKGGFVFKCYSTRKLMKTFDNRVVEMKVESISNWILRFNSRK